jgi:hypothetical protein
MPTAFPGRGSIATLGSDAESSRYPLAMCGTLHSQMLNAHLQNCDAASAKLRF